MLHLDLPVPVQHGDFHCLWCYKGGFPLQDLNAVFPQHTGDSGPRVLDQVFLSLFDPLEADLHVPFHEIARASGSDHQGIFQKSFCRDAPPVQACSTQETIFHKDRLEPFLGAPDG
jgi:hypothetical protein